MKKIAVLFIFIAFFIAGCGSDSDSDFFNTGHHNEEDEKMNGEQEKENGEQEEQNGEQEDENGETADEEKELLYPEVTPTSNKAGDIAQNVIMYDELDNRHQLAEWYSKNNKSSKLIWLIFTTYDCGPCKVLKASLAEINKKEYRDKGFNIVLIFNGYLAGPKTDEEPATIAAYKDNYLYAYPDTGQFALYAYLQDTPEDQNFFYQFSPGANNAAYPTWALIDAETMEILIYDQGWDKSLTERVINNIEMILD